MSKAIINLHVQPFRLMKKTDAAHYCARSPKVFEAQCPVRPVVMPNGDRLWDVHDLDAWIDGMKDDTNDDDAVIATLRRNRA